MEKDTRPALTNAPETEAAGASARSRLKRARGRAGEIVRRLPGGARLQTALRDRSLRSAVYAFALTRTIVFGVLILTAHVNLNPLDTSHGTRNFEILLDKIPVARLMRQTLHMADTNWYLTIAQKGYERRPFDADAAHNWAFFPLYPLLLRLASYVTGEFLLTGVVLSNIFFFFALLLLHKTALAFGLGHGDADRCIFYLSAFPTSYFFSLPLTESLFLLLTVGSFYAARRRAWWLAGLLGALSSATRTTGVLLLPALALLHRQTYGRDHWRRPDALALLLIPSGLFAFMCHLYLITGNPLAFKDAMAVWGRSGGFFLSPLLHYIFNPFRIIVPWSFHTLNFAAPATALACGCVLLRRREWALAFYTLACAFVALSSVLLQSQARYAMVIFPVFMVLAQAGRRRRVDEIIRAVSLVLLSLMTALLAAHFSVAMS